MNETSTFAETLRASLAAKASKAATVTKPKPRASPALHPHRYSHLRQPQRALAGEPGCALAALSEAVAARMEGREPRKLVSAPKQTVQRVSGADLIAAGRRAGVIPLKAPR